MKTFKEAFPGFIPDENLAELFKYIYVERVSASNDMSVLRIYIKSERLIEKDIIYKIEKMIKDKLFYGRQISIKIMEKFSLSDLYTAKNLYEAYKDSLIKEIKAYKTALSVLLNNSEISFDEKVMYLCFEDTFLNRTLGEELVDILEKVFNERCGITCEVITKYKEYKQKEYDIAPESANFAAVKEYNVKKESNTYKENGQLIVSKETDKLKTGNKDENKDLSENSAKNNKNTKKEAAFKRGENAKSYSKYNNYTKKINNPDVLYGRDFSDDFIEIKEIVGEMGEVSIRGKIIELDSRFLEKSQSTLFIFSLTDFTDSISIKMFVRENALEDAKNALVKGNFIKLRGVTTIDKFDGELVIGSVYGIKKSEDFGSLNRQDTSELKRVELHCHTKMSDFDGVCSADSLIKQAISWGWDALAITDHGNVQAFTEAYHTLEKVKQPFKLLYGVEGYLVDDLKELISRPGEHTLDDSFVVFDIETTGFSAKKDKIIEIGAVKLVSGEVVDRFSSFINPEIPIPFKIEELTGINDSMVIGEETIDKVLPRFLEFCKGSIAVAHNAAFDTGFIKAKSKELGLEYNPGIIDTVAMARILLPSLGRYKLDTVAKALNISLLNHHRAVDDANATALIWLEFIKILKDRGLFKLKEISKLGDSTKNVIKKMRATHVIIIAKNDIGRINLYKLISESHIEYFSKVPRIPKSLLNELREGLIVGSACEAGELYSAVLEGRPQEEIDRLVKFYDYLEIQPIANNRFMLNSDKYPVSSVEDLQEINKKIVGLAKEHNKPCVATCDVHFLNPEDEIYRKIILYGKGYSDADMQPPIYLRTTNEMLKEFEYLGEELCREVVITNTRKIADMVEYIKPVRPDKCPPVIPDSDEILTETCYKKAHEQYGDILPEIVEKRLKKELDSIIKNGFAVMYIIAQKLVSKSNEDGYLVGSRGSVGSSFAAYTAGITEVNPMPPHYYCDCKYVDFDSEQVKSFAGKAGCDLPDKLCPNCGKKLKKDGFDIPFETFLGFKGDKEPDIDLNFSGEYQPRAHDYTEEIFGKGYTFRAGTVGTLADKTAYGYVKNYYEEHGERKRKCEINRITGGCVGVRRTTGQHPGGIIVVPHGEEIYSFTPIQRPANDVNTKIITTHFDYHAIDHNLLKLDILGHMDPTMIRVLSDLTGIDPVKDIPLDCKETMSLFQNTSALGVKPEDILGCPLGALGVPEFGTDFAMQMLIDTKPKGLSDLVRIAGLAHGTDVWLGNAQVLIQEGKAEIGTAICTRDDIMIYLINQGMEEGLAFKIMEAVRKGKGLTPDNEEEMRKLGVPEWYIWSCNKIKYMFPKAHAAAYVMMAWRIAYCKIFYPVAYYTAFFTVRASAFSYELMCFGKEKLEYNIRQVEMKKANNTASAKDLDTLRDMKIVQEMYARGFSFAPIDLYSAKATAFKITDDNKIMPSLTSIDGLGETAAKQINQAASAGKFISKDDLMSRAKIGKSTCELLDRLGILGNLPNSNQLSIFDML